MVDPLEAHHVGPPIGRSSDPSMLSLLWQSYSSRPTDMSYSHLKVGHRKQLAFGICIMLRPSACDATSSMRRVRLRGNPDEEYNQCTH